MKGAGANLLIIVGLSVAVWFFFDSYAMRLDEQGTLVVVFLCTLVVLAGRWLLGSVHKLWKGTGHER